jgi:LPXTG-site transpeptidase (sortase) family protein
MRYKYNKRQRHIPRRGLAAGALCFALFSGLYLLLLAYSPQLDFIPSNVKAAPVIHPDKNDYVMIDKINLKVPFFVGQEEVLSKGAWHRYPKRGDPEKGGNFILSAHRFNLGLTPQGTIAKSPFYNLHLLSPGDKITVVYKHKDYSYKVDKIYEVQSNDTWVENPSNTAKLTLYSCSMKGQDAGRLVVEATPVN